MDIKEGICTCGGKPVRATSTKFSLLENQIRVFLFRCLQIIYHSSLAFQPQFSFLYQLPKTISSLSKTQNFPSKKFATLLIIQIPSIDLFWRYCREKRRFSIPRGCLHTYIQNQNWISFLENPNRFDWKTFHLHFGVGLKMLHYTRERIFACFFLHQMFPQKQKPLHKLRVRKPLVTIRFATCSKNFYVGDSQCRAQTLFWDTTCKSQRRRN